MRTPSSLIDLLIRFLDKQMSTSTLHTMNENTPVAQELIQEYSNVVIPSCTLAYTESLLAPYYSSVSVATDAAAVNDWMDAVLTDEQSAIFNQNLKQDSVENAPEYAIDSLRALMHGFIRKLDFTDPWFVLESMGGFLKENPYADNKTIQVNVVVGASSYPHEMTYELAYGILSATTYKLYVADCELWKETYHRRPSDNYYEATVNGSTVQFNTDDFLQGIITAAEWDNVDAHTLIANFVQNNGEITIPVEF